MSVYVISITAFSARVIAKKKRYTKRRSLQQRPLVSPPSTSAIRYTAIPKYAHFPSSLHAEYDMGILPSVLLCHFLYSDLSFFFNPGEIMWSAARAPLFLWVKRGVKRRKKQVSIPPFTEGKALRQGKGSLAPAAAARNCGLGSLRMARLGFLQDLRPETEACRKCLSVHVRARAEI